MWLEVHTQLTLFIMDTDRVREFFDAIGNGDEPAIRRLALHFGKPLLNFTGDRFATPLGYALQRSRGTQGENSCWKLLLELGADPVLFAHDKNPIIIAIETANVDFIEAVVAAKPFASYQGRYLLTRDHYSANAEELAQIERPFSPISALFCERWSEGALAAVRTVARLPNFDPNFTLPADPDMRMLGDAPLSVLHSAAFYGLDTVVEELICHLGADPMPRGGRNLFQTLAHGIEYYSSTHYKPRKECRTNAAPPTLPEGFVIACSHILNAGVDPRDGDAIRVIDRALIREPMITKSIHHNLALRSIVDYLTRAVHDKESKLSCLSDGIMDMILEAYHPGYKRKCNVH